MRPFQPRILGVAFGICLITAVSANAQTFTLLHSFDRDDGAQPLGDLVLVRGKLYGTTYSGGVNNIGTVYSVTPTGTFKSLYSFSGQYAGPLGALHRVGKILYGTTQAGGNLDDCSPMGCGTVFSITRKGAVTSLYSFQRQGDGAFPYGALSGSGPLYGVTNAGGTYDEGTVFSISTDGTEKIIYSFQGSPDAARPGAGLIKHNEVFYGTTNSGGANNAGSIADDAQRGGNRHLKPSRRRRWCISERFIAPENMASCTAPQATVAFQVAHSLAAAPSSRLRSQEKKECFIGSREGKTMAPIHLPV